MSHDAVSAHARQYRRHSARYEARITPVSEHADQFRLAVPDAQTGLAVTDVSAGGLGLRSGLFLPKNLRIALSIKDLDEANAARQDLSVRVIVRSCTMVDHSPAYQVGLQYVDPAGRDEQTLVRHAARPSVAADQPVVVGDSGS
jgi:hypothetical protein